MAIQQVRNKDINKVLDVEYDDVTGLCNGSNADNWNNLLEFSGSEGSWSVSFTHDCYADIFEIV